MCGILNNWVVDHGLIILSGKDQSERGLIIYYLSVKSHRKEIVQSDCVCDMTPSTHCINLLSSYNINLSLCMTLFLFLCKCKWERLFT